MKKNKKMLFIIIGILLIFLIAFIIIILSRKEPQQEMEEELDLEELESNFGSLFDNNENEYVSCLYHLEEETRGKYKINADIPYVHINNNINIDNDINKSINNLFVNKIKKIVEEGDMYTYLEIDYSTSTNNNILSLVIKCVLKEGSNIQRTIVKTYNYNIETGKQVNITDLISNEKKETVQQLVYTKIKNEIKRKQAIIGQGYNEYVRDIDNDVYLLENSTEFYIENNILYIIYSYGNSEYTSAMDIIATKI